MKAVFILALFFCSAAVFAQGPIHGKIKSYPNIHPDSLKAHTAFAKRCSDLEKAGKHEELQAYMAKFPDYDFPSEAFDDEGPYYTGPYGCSFYCLAGIDTIVATSTLTSGKKSTYFPANAHDFDLQTAWVEGKSDDGTGEALEFDFSKSPPLTVTACTIYNGYTKNLQVWKDNGRAKSVEVMVNGESKAVLQLEDTYLGQTFELGKLAAATDGTLRISFRILEVYKGDKYSDTAISEINFDGPSH
jgi:hypothetical protein